MLAGGCFGRRSAWIGRKEIRIDDPSFFTALSALIASHPAEYFMPYVQWQVSERHIDGLRCSDTCALR
jgi:hypothetical protein